VESKAYGVGGGFKADPVLLEEARKRVTAAHDYFQGKLDIKKGLSAVLADSFSGNFGETGAFQRRYQRFGEAWTAELAKMIQLDELFVSMINEHADALRQASAMYAQADENARLTLQTILDDIK
jgi:hypothetical protein